MGKRNKLGKFSEILRNPIVLENYNHQNDLLTIAEGKFLNPKGQWNELIFKKDQPITLELACGKGEYAVGLAERFPERNFIGIDIKGARIWKGASDAVENGITNVRFLRTRIEMLYKFFEQNEISEIWITFPDPFLKDKKKNRRLTSPTFLKMYKNLLKDNGLVHLKTDSHLLYYYTLDLLKYRVDIPIQYYYNHIYQQALDIPELEIKTYYEKKHLERKRTIKYIRFSL